MDYFSCNSPGDRARKVFIPSKDAEILLDLTKKTGKFWIWVFCGLHHNRGRVRSFIPTSSGPEP